MDKFHIIVFLSLFFSIVSLNMWYIYGAIDAINIDTHSRDDKNFYRIEKYQYTYKTRLVLSALFNSFCSIYLFSKLEYGYVYSIIILLLTAIFKHLGFHHEKDYNKIIFFIADKFYIIEFPITLVMTGIITITCNFIGLDIEKEYIEVTEDEIISIVNDGMEQGILDNDEAQRINNIVELGSKEAMDIMTHRINVEALSTDMSMSEVYDKVNDSKFSRLPVYKEEIDNIIGILHVKDLLKIIRIIDMDKKLDDYVDFLRKPYLVPNTKNIDDIFKYMQTEKTHLAIVIDEFGQLDGVLSIEDIIEEVMGNIIDEFDDDEKLVVELDNKKFIFRGICPLEIVAEKLNIDFSEEFETLNGFLTSRIGRILKDDENQIDVKYCGYNFRVQKVKNKVIQLVKITYLGG